MSNNTKKNLKRAGMVLGGIALCIFGYRFGKAFMAGTPDEILDHAKEIYDGMNK